MLRKLHLLMRKWTRVIRRINIIINQMLLPKQPLEMIHLELLILKTITFMLIISLSKNVKKSLALFKMKPSLVVELEQYIII